MWGAGFLIHATGSSQEGRFWRLIVACEIGRWERVGLFRGKVASGFGFGSRLGEVLGVLFACLVGGKSRWKMMLFLLLSCLAAGLRAVCEF